MELVEEQGVFYLKVDGKPIMFLSYGVDRHDVSKDIINVSINPKLWGSGYKAVKMTENPIGIYFVMLRKEGDRDG